LRWVWPPACSGNTASPCRRPPSAEVAI
jgi:hypothetical protein